MRPTFTARPSAILRVAIALALLSAAGPDRARGAEPGAPTGAGATPGIKTPVTVPQPAKPPAAAATGATGAPKAPTPPPAAATTPASPSAETPPAGSAASPDRVITVRQDRLTVRVTDVALDEIVREVAAPSKAEVKGSVKDPKPVSADFADVPLQDGLTRLLGEQNFLLTYREDGTLRSLTLLGGPVEEAQGAQVVKTAPAPPPAAPSPVDLLQRSVPVSGKLQELLGQPTATMQQLMDITMRQDDAGLRLEAMRAGMNAIDTQADMRSTVVKSLEGIDDQALEAMVRNMAPNHAQEVMSQMAATSRTPEIRARSLRVLRSLNQSPGGGPE
jgi:hypothetical protein